jgi:uncharacterized protein YpuA (DUF1002 family)
MQKTLEQKKAEGREGLAKSIYDQMTYTDKGTKPKWVEGGNSLKQDEARRMANKLDLDQHTANTWKAAQEESQKCIKELEAEVLDLAETLSGIDI